MATSTYHQNRILFNLALVAFLAVGSVVGLNLVNNPKGLRFAGAWDCSKYTFNVSQQGQVSVVNTSAKNEVAQKVDIFINDVKVATLDAPALAAYGVTPVVIGTVTVPSNGIFSWKADGAVDCVNAGKYTEALSCDFVDIVVPDPNQGLTGSYFKSSSFEILGLTRVDPQVNFDWGEAAPVAGLPVDGFSIEWKGFIDLPFDGHYLFSVEKDMNNTTTTPQFSPNLVTFNGIAGRVLNNEIVFPLADGRTTHPSTASEIAYATRLAKGKYAVTLRYADPLGIAKINLKWDAVEILSGTATPTLGSRTISKQTIPASSLWIK